jgi:hypothetical protein
MLTWLKVTRARSLRLKQESKRLPVPKLVMIRLDMWREITRLNGDVKDKRPGLELSPWIVAWSD